jgi:hypothetical protein
MGNIGSHVNLTSGSTKTSSDLALEAAAASTSLRPREALTTDGMRPRVVKILRTANLVTKYGHLTNRGRGSGPAHSRSE